MKGFVRNKFALNFCLTFVKLTELEQFRFFLKVSWIQSNPKTNELYVQSLLFGSYINALWFVRYFANTQTQSWTEKLNFPFLPLSVVSNTFFIKPSIKEKKKRTMNQPWRSSRTERKLTQMSGVMLGHLQWQNVMTYEAYGSEHIERSQCRSNCFVFTWCYVRKSIFDLGLF